MKKHGFSMAELLLSLAIIGIITSMGVTATKRSSQKAYNLYFYNGYSTLQDVLYDILDSTKDGETPTINKKTLKEYFSEGIKDEEDAEGNDKDPNTIKTKNGIEYEIIEGDSSDYIIEMRVPQIKTRANNSGQAKTLLYFNANKSENPHGDLVPFNDGTGYINLQNNKRLIAFYIDNGEYGKVEAPSEGGKTVRKYIKIPFYDYKTAYCKNTTNQKSTIHTVGSYDASINCAGITQYDKGGPIMPASGR